MKKTKLVKETLYEMDRHEMMQINNELEDLWIDAQKTGEWKSFEDFANDPNVLKNLRGDGAGHGWKKNDKASLVRRSLLDDDDEKLKYF